MAKLWTLVRKKGIYMQKKQNVKRDTSFSNTFSGPIPIHASMTFFHFKKHHQLKETWNAIKGLASMCTYILLPLALYEYRLPLMTKPIFTYMQINSSEYLNSIT